MSTIERPDGTTIHYQVSGEPGAPAVMLGHSLLCDVRMWEFVAPKLAERHRVINVDARGHGGSRAPAPFTIDDLADDWLAILDAEKLDRAALCGLSMGGMTAMRLALKAPERVSRLALLDTSADEELPRWKRIEYFALAEIIRRIGHVNPVYAIARRALTGRTTRRENPALADEVVRRIKDQRPAELYHATRAVFGRAAIHDRLGGIRCPTLVLVGDEDTATPLLRAQRIATAIPGAALRILPRSGHLSALENPAAVLREITPFLAA